MKRRDANKRLKVEIEEWKLEEDKRRALENRIQRVEKMEAIGNLQFHWGPPPGSSPVRNRRYRGHQDYFPNR